MKTWQEGNNHLLAKHFIYLYAKSQIILRYRRTQIRFWWMLIEPSLYLTVLSLVFAVVNQMNIREYAVFLFSALVPWRYFEAAVNNGIGSIVAGEWLLKKVYTPPAILPLTQWLVATVDFFFSLVIAAVIMGILKAHWSIHILILPLSIIVWAGFALGVSMIFSVIFVFFRDVRPLVQIGLMLTFFSSPILINADLYFKSQLMRFHPFTYFTALFRNPLYFEQWPGAKDWIVAGTLAILSLGLGYYLIRHYKNRFYFYL